VEKVDGVANTSSYQRDKMMAKADEIHGSPPFSGERTLV
jgi:hypothetical protein